MKSIQRIGRQRLDATGYPGLLPHSSLFDSMEKICAHGLALGRTRCVRNDNFCAHADDAAHKSGAANPEKHYPAPLG